LGARRPRGNPQAKNLFAVIGCLQKKTAASARGGLGHGE